MISFAIPNYNRVQTVMKLVREHAVNDHVAEIVICDDASSAAVVQELKTALGAYPKARLVENQNNLGLFFNKLRTVQNCTQEWVVLCDSDNFMGKDYTDALHRETPWDYGTVYCPERVGPFDFSAMGGYMMSTLQELRETLKRVVAIGDVFLNTGNYFFNRDMYVDVCQQFPKLGLDPHKLWAAEVHALNYAWVASGGKIKCVKGLQYFHDTTNADSSWRRITATLEGRRGSEAIRNEINRRIQQGR